MGRCIDEVKSKIESKRLGKREKKKCVSFYKGSGVLKFL